VFDISLAELFVLGTAALTVLGPKRLPGALRALGHGLAKIRRLATKLSTESGFGEVLHSSSFHGRVQEFGSLTLAPATSASPSEQSTTFVADKSREYPAEGPDAQGAIPEDLLPATLPSS
jgi:sec-independent protein translocase protein TatB